MTDILKVKVNGQWRGIAVTQGDKSQIQSDWSQSDNTKKDFIKNKPTKISDFTDDTLTNPIDKADTLTGLTATVSELNVLDTSGWVSYGDSLPFGICHSTTSTTANIIDQTFQSIGYIGSTIFARKGLKVLIPNGRNTDGTLKNIEATLPNTTVRTFTQTNAARFLGINETSITWSTPSSYSYDANSNYSYSTTERTSPWVAAVIGGFSTDAVGNISNFQPYSAVSINSMCDGQWVASDSVLASNVNYPTSSDITYSLSSYLPNDGYNYDVLVGGRVTTGSTSGNYLALAISTSLIYGDIDLCSARTRSSSTMTGRGCCVIPVGVDRNITVTKDSAANGTFVLYARAYRRVGTNN